jgi:hypothetical protein
MIGHPALRLLIRMKLKASLRGQLRRMRRPSSWIFAILGFLLIVFWLASVFISGAFQSNIAIGRDAAVFAVQVALLVLCLMTAFGAFNHRGLYLPKEEIEIAFSGPIARSDLVRYRLVVNLLRSVFAGAFFGLGATRRLSSGGFTFAGVMLTMLTLPILGQALSLLLGDAENRFARAAKKLPLRVVSIVLGVVVGLGVAALFFDTGLAQRWFQGGALERIVSSTTVAEGIVPVLLSPFKPWALMITAQSASEFWPWFALCAAIACAAFEATARIPIDFRELSLATSADIAKRLRRIRRGGIGIGSATVSKDTLAWNVPWIFGRKSFGAIAWLKLAAILRKARGTLLVSTLIIAFVTLLITSMAHDAGKDQALQALVGAGMITVIGSVYLAVALRLDFRNDLEQMEIVKAFPVRPSAVFLATILPQTALVSILLAAAVVVRALATNSFVPLLLPLIALQPLVTLGWVAIDNVVFLFSPVRYTPGQEGALQQTGRSVLLMVVRFTALLAVLIVAGAPSVAAYFACIHHRIGLSSDSALLVGAAVLWCGLALVDAGLVLAGGFMLRRFDVARDRG